MKKEYSFEVIDRCEALYVSEGRTYEEISKISKNWIPASAGMTDKKGVSVQQLQRWGKKYDWKEKRGNLKKSSLDANTQARGLASEKILEDLKKHKERYEKFFENLPEGQINVGASQQYTLVCKTICDLLAKKEQKVDPSVFLDFMRDLVSYLREHDPEALTALEKNFDEFVGWAKQKYA